MHTKATFIFSAALLLAVVATMMCALPRGVHAANDRPKTKSPTHANAWIAKLHEERREAHARGFEERLRLTPAEAQHVGRRARPLPVVARFEAWVTRTASQAPRRLARMRSNDAAAHHRLAAKWCKRRRARRGARCTWREYQALVDAMHAPHAQNFDHSDGRAAVPLATLRAHGKGVGDCARLNKLPSAEEFYRLVVANKPVVFVDAASKWPAMKRWTNKYLVDRLKGTPVVLSASPHGFFDSPEDASLWGTPPPEERKRRRTLANKDAGAAELEVRADGSTTGGGAAAVSDDHGDDGFNPTDDVVIARPGHISTTFEKFVALMNRARDGAAKLYLEYFPLMALLYPNGDPGAAEARDPAATEAAAAAAGKGDTAKTKAKTKAKPSASDLVGDLGVFKGDWSFANFLIPRFRLIWMGSAGTVGSLHFDRNENLMAVLRGAKDFVLVDPGQTESVYGGLPLRSASLEAALDGATGALRFARPPLDTTGPSAEAPNAYNSYSPVNMTDPDLKHFPRYADVNFTVCRAWAGDVIYVPSHWWHEVTSRPDAEGKTVGVNYFFEPWYERLGHNNRSPVLVRNKLYGHLVGEEFGGVGLAQPCAAEEVCFTRKGGNGAPVTDADEDRARRLRHAPGMEFPGSDLGAAEGGGGAGPGMMSDDHEFGADPIGDKAERTKLQALAQKLADRQKEEHERQTATLAYLETHGARPERRRAKDQRDGGGDEPAAPRKKSKKKQKKKKKKKRKRKKKQGGKKKAD